jgi:8-oxo-dGTP pyrophosphatase MutT (NUDIX family)
MSSRFSTVAALEAFLIERLAQPLPGAAAQRKFAPLPPRKGWEPNLVPDGERHAAALLLIYPGPAGPSIVLTVRRDDLPRHPGQVSLPGGGLDPGETHHETALREAEEEIGLSPRDVRVIGRLSSLWVIVSGFVVFPFVGIVDTRPDFQPEAREVKQLLEVPVAHVLDRGRLNWERRTRDNVVVRYACFDLGGHKVWGATGMILSEFAALFDPDFTPGPPPE